jgi:hypothetical protein
MRKGEVIVFGVRVINRLTADPALPLSSLVYRALFRIIEEPLRIASNTDVFDNFGTPFGIIFCDGGSRCGLSARRGIPVGQNVTGQLLCERVVEFEEAVA